MPHAPAPRKVRNAHERAAVVPFEHDEKLLDELWQEARNRKRAFGLGPTGDEVKDIAKTYAMQILRKYGR